MRPAPARRSARFELAGMVVLAAGLAALLTHHVLQADGFFLDDWLYTQTAEFIGQHAPGAAWGEIPNWTRGAQRLYPIVLAPVWGSLDASPAYTLSHLVNVALLTSSVIPAALLARRFVDGALLRVLAVALAVVLPPLTIGATLLTENLATPLLLWAVYLITRTAERPTLLNQIAALACIGALALTRLNLAATFAVLVVTVAVAELLELRDAADSRRAWLRAALRRRAVLLAATVVVVAAAVWTFRSGGPGGLGVYADGGAQSGQLRAMWAERDAVVEAVATYARSIVAGAFVFPFALGLAGALAAMRGALGRRAVLASVAAVSCLAISLLVVSAYTRNGPFEERYAFYFYPPIALFAVAAVQHLRRIPIELVVASGVTLWALDRGAVRPSGVHFHYFSWPAEAFWDRVVEHRLVRLEGSLPGWLPASESGWQLIACALILLLVVALAARFAPARLRRVPLAGLLSAGLLACVVAQALALNYAFGALMHGFPEQPGGYAGAPGHAADRLAWVDKGLPDGSRSALLAPMPRPGSPFGGAEAAQYWNRSLDAVVALRFSDAPIVDGAGLYTVESTLENATPTWSSPLDVSWLVTAKDEPRVQFAGTATTAPEAPGYSFVKLEKPVRGLWAVTGIEPDGHVPANGYATMALTRQPGDGVRAVRLRIRGADALPGRARFHISRLDGRGEAVVRQVLTGQVRAGQEKTVTLTAPRCTAPCPKAFWRLTPSGSPAMVPLPVFGPAPPPRPVQLQLTAARLVRG